MTEPQTEHEKVSGALSGLRCMAIWLRSVHLDSQADDLDSYREDLNERRELPAGTFLASTSSRYYQPDCESDTIKCVWLR